MAGAGGSSAGGVPAAPPADAGSFVPPPPPVGDFVISTSAGDAPKPAVPGGLAAVFADINKGSNITSGLKHVTKDMKTKNMKDLYVDQLASLCLCSCWAVMRYPWA